MSDLPSYKIIVLIIDHTASLNQEDRDPAVPNFKGSYLDLLNGFKASWRNYMNKDPEILCLFLGVNDSFAPEQYELDLPTNTLTVSGTETCNSKPSLSYDSPISYGKCISYGILRKTLTAMTHVNQLFQYDFLMRTNLSCFFNMPKLKEIIMRQRKTQFFGGAVMGCFALGGLQVYSPDVCQYLVDTSDTLKELFNKNPHAEDGLISNFTNAVYGLTEITSYDAIDFTKQLDNHELIKCKVMFRIKQVNNSDDREFDLYTHDKLYQLIYDNTAYVRPLPAHAPELAAPELAPTPKRPTNIHVTKKRKPITTHPLPPTLQTNSVINRMMSHLRIKRPLKK